jgi:PKD repeat protein
METEIIQQIQFGALILETIPEVPQHLDLGWDPSDGVDEGFDDPDGVNYDLIWKVGLNNAAEDTSPIVADGKVIIPTRNGYLHTFDAYTGDQIWVEYDTYMRSYSQRTTPAIAYDKLFYSFYKTLYVYSLNQKPIADIAVNPIFGNVTTIFNFNGTNSFDPDGEYVSFAWQLGDGNWSNKIDFNYQFLDDGIYNVNLTVRDNDGVYSDPKIITITINNLPPLANFSVNRTQILEGEGIKFDASQTSDPDDILLTYSLDFGDGKVAEGLEVSHNFTEIGIYTIELTVTDDDGASDKYQRIIEVTKLTSDDDKPVHFFSNIWNILSLSLVIILIVSILALIVPKHQKESETQDDSEPIFPSIVDISCPECGEIFEIPEKPRPLQIECPHCGTKGLIN